MMRSKKANMSEIMMIGVNPHVVFRATSSTLTSMI
jgi:hypothetical protein